jgi:hypothetical protein
MFLVPVSEFDPPYLAFTDNGTLFGSAARAQAKLNPKNTIFGLMYVPKTPCFYFVVL